MLVPVNEQESNFQSNQRKKLDKLENVRLANPYFTRTGDSLAEMNGSIKNVRSYEIGDGVCLIGD